MIFALRANASVPGTGTDQSDGSAASGSGSATTSPAQLAWQGVIYLPENKLTDVTSGDVTTSQRTTLTFNSEAGTPSDKAGEEGKLVNLVANPYTVKLIEGATQNGTAAAATTIERGKFYDLCIKATKLKKYDLEFTVKDWDIEQLVYELQGPNFLYVDKTLVSVEAGETSYIEYNTNVAKLEYSSAVYNRKNADGTTEAIPIYEFEAKNGKIEITVNSRLSADECQEITAATNSTTDPNKDSYNYFHIKAGNINKKVNVYPLSLDPFLTVEPEEITINVREQLSSGKYDNITNPFKVVVKTNFDNYKITSAEWGELGVTGNTSDILYLAYKDANGNYQKVNFNTDLDKPESGRDEYYLIYTGLNDGNKFWSEKDHTLILTFTPEGKTKEAKTVKISTQRSSDNYIIYFKAPDDWKNPHIYVYQCLEIPGNHHYNKTFHSKQYDMAGMPVGYYKGDPATTNEAWAALEYSFTGKIAFKGWNDGNNQQALNDSKSPSYTCNSAQGFFAFTDGCGTDDNSWNASKDASDKRYEKKMDFCADWREELADVCSYCLNSFPNINGNHGYNALWPGIAMIKEGDWYKFELTSVATPGKALIMFTDLHDRAGTELNDDFDNRRYPEKDMVGIPLFDYPNRIGYFNLAEGKKYFTNTSTGTQPVQTGKYVVYFENSGNWSQPQVYCWADEIKNAGWPGVDMTHVSGNIWKYETDIKYDKVIFSKKNDNDNNKTQDAEFKSGYKYIWSGQWVVPSMSKYQ